MALPTRKATNHDPLIAQKIDPEIRQLVEGRWQGGKPVLIVRRDELEPLAKGSWRSRLPIAWPIEQRSAGLFASGGFWRTMHARPDACTRAILDSRLA
jgi:hypothetical protein